METRKGIWRISLLVSLLSLVFITPSAAAVPVDWWGIITIDANSSAGAVDNTTVEAFIGDSSSANASDIVGTPDSGYYLIHVNCIQGNNVTLKIDGVSVFEGGQSCLAGGSSVELNMSMNKTGNGENCTYSGGCTSGNCANDYDGAGAWCAASGLCASDNVTTANAGTACSDTSTLQTCTSGTWVSSACANGCSNGACSGSSSGGSSGGGGGGGTTTTEDEETTTVEETPVLTPGKSLETNTKLLEAIERLIEKDLNAAEISNIVKLSEFITSQTDVSRTFTSDETTSTISTTFAYKGSRKVKNFIVYEKLPKSFAQSSDDITVSAAGSKAIEIVEKDPEYAITFHEVNPGQSVSITYSVNEKVAETVLTGMGTELYGEELVEIQKTVCGNGICEPGEVGSCPQDCPLAAPPEPPSPVTTILVALIIVLVIVAGIYFFYRKKK